jgi:hypothetical protein
VIQTPPDKECYNYEEKGHFAITCPNPWTRPPLTPSTKVAPNHKGSSTITYFNCGKIGHSTNWCLDKRQLSTPTLNLYEDSTPTEVNQNVAWTLAYRKCYNWGQKGHFTNVCSNLWYCPDVTPVATSIPYRSANSTMANAHQDSMRGQVNQVAMEEAQNTPMTGTFLINLNPVITIPSSLFFSAMRISERDSF